MCFWFSYKTVGILSWYPELSLRLVFDHTHNARAPNYTCRSHSTDILITKNPGLMNIKTKFKTKIINLSQDD